MLTKRLILFLTISSAIFADGGVSNSLSEKYVESVQAEKVMGVLSILDDKIDALDAKIYEAIEKKITEDIDKHLDNKFETLAGRKHDLEENFEGKMQKLEKNLLDKLEYFIEERLTTLERHVNRKIDAQDNTMPDKTDIDILSKKLDAIKRMQLQSVESTYFKPNALSNETRETNNECPGLYTRIIQEEISELENKLDALHKNQSEFETSKTMCKGINPNIITINENISDLKNDINILKLDSLNKNFTAVEEQLRVNYDDLKKKIPNLEANITQKLDTFDNKINQNLEQLMNTKLDTMKNRLLNKMNTCNDLSTSQNKLLKNVFGKLNEIEKNTSNNNKIMDILQKLNQGVQTHKDHQARCKAEATQGYAYKSFYRLNDPSLEHVKLRTNSQGDLIEFKMNVAITSTKVGLIMFSATPNPSVNDFYFEIVVGAYFNKYTRLRVKGFDKGKFVVGNTPIEKDTPNILSPSEFRRFWVKVSDTTMDFGKEGSSSPIMSYNDAKMKTIKYFSFSSWDEKDVYTSYYLYDC